MTRCIIKSIFLPALKDGSGFYDVATNRTIGFHLLEINGDNESDIEYTVIELTNNENVKLHVGDTVELNSGYVYSFFVFDETNRVILNMTRDSLLKASSIRLQA